MGGKSGRVSQCPAEAWCVTGTPWIIPFCFASKFHICKKELEPGTSIGFLPSNHCSQPSPKFTATGDIFLKTWLIPGQRLEEGGEGASQRDYQEREGTHHQLRPQPGVPRCSNCRQATDLPGPTCEPDLAQQSELLGLVQALPGTGRSPGCPRANVTSPGRW